MRKLCLLGILIGAVAFGVACSSSSPNGIIGGDDTCENCGNDAGADATVDAGIDATTCAAQSYPPNGASCPTTYSYTYGGQLCSPVDTQCYYPGAGDIGANGCAATAMLMCEPRDAGVGGMPDAAIFDDAGDADVGYWIFAQ
jgi:hypothetical protein